MCEDGCGCKIFKWSTQWPNDVDDDDDDDDIYERKAQVLHMWISFLLLT